MLAIAAIDSISSNRVSLEERCEEACIEVTRLNSLVESITMAGGETSRDKGGTRTALGNQKILVVIGNSIRLSASFSMRDGI